MPHPKRETVTKIKGAAAPLPRSDLDVREFIKNGSKNRCEGNIAVLLSCNVEATGRIPIERESARTLKPHLE
jgi:hypothetical protein